MTKQEKKIINQIRACPWRVGADGKRDELINSICRLHVLPCIKVIQKDKCEVYK